MNKFLKIIQLATVVTATSTVALSVGLAKQENNSIVNLQKDNYQDWRIEKLPDLSGLAKEMTIFNNELYMVMNGGGLTKIDKQGNIIYLIPDPKEIKITAMAEFNNYLYISNELGQIFKVDKQGNLVDFKEQFNIGIRIMTEFNGYLYVALESGRVYKIDKNERITFVKLPISYVSTIDLMIVFNNHLYMTRADNKFFKIDQNEMLTNLKLGEVDFIIKDMIIFDNELYIAVDYSKSLCSSVLKLDKEDDVTHTDLLFTLISSLAVFNNELYIGAYDNCLRKLNNDGAIIDVISIDGSFIFKLHAFNGELYICHDMYGFSKLTNK